MSETLPPHKLAQYDQLFATASDLLDNAVAGFKYDLGEHSEVDIVVDLAVALRHVATEFAGGVDPIVDMLSVAIARLAKL